MKSWFPASWQDYPYLQSVDYPDKQALVLAMTALSLQPPLVPVHEIQALKHTMAKAATGAVFVLQGGDCAESFQNCRPEFLNNQLNILLKMRDVLTCRIQKPVICVGRIAGQYAKPRSNDWEMQDGISLPSYRGELINSKAFTRRARAPDPARLLRAYHAATFTLHHIRVFFMHRAVSNFYTAHEALHLHYEQALTRQDPHGGWYNQSTHFPWIGMRTAYPNTAHVELLRGINNPIGIKIGPHFNIDLLKDLISQLNPTQEAGRITLITRLGAGTVENLLPVIIKKIQLLETPVTWICDPMHGNTETTENGIKTRHFDNILSELRQTISIHQTMNSLLGGVHFELTGEHVTECIGGADNTQITDLTKAYFSLMDPRLNYEQSLNMATALSLLLKPF